MKPEQASISKTESAPEPLSEGHWFCIVENLYKESGVVPDPLQIRAASIISALGIPRGEVSALETDKEGKRLNPEKDRIIAEYLTNRSGVVIDKEQGIVSTDFRDIYPDGLPEELAGALDPDTRAIMELEYEHARDTRERFGDTKNDLEADSPVNYFRLPGGVGLFLRGYNHEPEWQRNHGKFLKQANARARVIAIEGSTVFPFGSSLERWWADPWVQGGHYDVLMKEAVEEGFDGLFTEVDARDVSRVQMDTAGLPSLFLFSELPQRVFDEYFMFFKKEHPKLAELLGSPQGLKEVLRAQALSEKRKRGSPTSVKVVYKDSKQYIANTYVSADGAVSLEPTFRELGQLMFTDALAAIKLHLIAKLMADGHISKGPIVDYEGAAHLSSKQFFLRYPRYAMEVVLRAINELMAGKVRKGEAGIEDMYEVFRNPDWAEALKEIARLSFKKPEDDASKPVRPGPGQRKLLDYPVDFFKTYGIDPDKAMPTDEEILALREKLSSTMTD